jgi:fumarate hydratase, class II
VRNDDVTDTEYRIEHDTMGEVRVPKNALYAAQTQRAVENFPISGDPLEAAQIVALARIKKAAALANKELGTLDGAIADAIAGAADRIIAGEFADQFPIDVYQTGSGRSSRPSRRSRSGPRCTPTTTSTPRSRPTTSSPRPCTSP